jgi:excisionase family DNA binding protein
MTADGVERKARPGRHANVGQPLTSVGKLYDVKAQPAADYLGISVETIKRWARQHKLPAVKTISGTWLFCREDLDGLAVHAVRVVDGVQRSA